MNTINFGGSKTRMDNSMLFRFINTNQLNIDISLNGPYDTRLKLLYMFISNGVFKNIERIA